MNRPIRVLLVLGELKPSGAEMMLLTAAPIFRRHGVSGEILSTGAQPGALADRLELAGYDVHHIPFSKSASFFQRLHALMSRRYDVVHVHTERAAFWVALTARVTGTFVIVRTIHATFAFKGHLRLRRKAQRRLARWMGVRHVAVGRSVAEVEARHFGIRPEVICNWYDSGRFVARSEKDRRRARTALDIDGGQMVITTVGNCAPVKNHVSLIQALVALPASIRPLYLHVGAEQPGSSERRLAERLGLDDRVRFLGRREDVRTVLDAADAFVMPSLHEGCSIAAVEALAVGVPVILSEVDGLQDFRDEFEGLIYCKPDAESLAAALDAFLALRPEERDRLSLKHPAAAREVYGMDRGVAAYVAMYRGHSSPETPRG